MMPAAAEARAALASRLGKRGYAHSVAVAQTAARLADAYGVDAREAYLAGLLHDWSRDEDGATLCAEAVRLGIDATPVDEAVPYLLHARTGAAALRERFPGLPERILESVERHTFGGPDMTDLDRVVYLADALEPARDTPAVDELREQVGRASLDELYARAYAAALEHLIRRRRRIHPATVDAWNSIVGESG
ncbi:MAG: bis(5'-nucleosyl)-tetraphosphatase (symmetrical) YqeK [Anaerosomatales bacterium]|nr:bis(5'-nucleosyl)-tetraphosphatase (symmetrical) YqeK [Anaerosomatales bacterium]MDT8433542.1 bis(5'-nucleosyl)-tetraphosphatase (symmetrical) YqeK [Anaerosomatales bacterium]